jgi:hypothetical protein
MPNGKRSTVANSLADWIAYWSEILMILSNHSTGNIPGTCPEPSPWILCRLSPIDCALGKKGGR